MTETEFKLVTIEYKIDRLEDAIKKALESQAQVKEMPEWLTLAAATELKGGCSPSTYKSHYYMQPCAGTNYKKIGGVKCWKKEDVIEWLKVSDDELKPYAEKFGVQFTKK